ncbi:ArsR/SmtB family transcription factor [Paracoccus luteus]|uniref:ArsR/SmtB family transcription factor n=1 Tax=Paracoccus luteus TaxID=2508543 RepID=UPI001C70AE9F|nr:metalloregulator ArsR/SmtB family transcription factor [Paracoccus luteus]
MTAPAPQPLRPDPAAEPGLMAARAAEAAALLKALAHEGRLMILCHLVTGEKSVGELETLLGQRQAAVSQQLARLREDGLVSCRPDGKARLYALADDRAAEMMGALHRVFCADPAGRP